MSVHTYGLSELSSFFNVQLVVSLLIVAVVLYILKIAVKTILRVFLVAIVVWLIYLLLVYYGLV